jgi:hypothetical protein
VVTVVDQAQDKARELEAAENNSETFESGCDRLMDFAQCMDDEAEEKSWDELAEITKNMQYNRNCT